MRALHALLDEIGPHTGAALKALYETDTDYETYVHSALASRYDIETNARGLVKRIENSTNSQVAATWFSQVVQDPADVAKLVESSTDTTFILTVLQRFAHPAVLNALEGKTEVLNEMRSFGSLGTNFHHIVHLPPHVALRVSQTQLEEDEADEIYIKWWHKCGSKYSDQQASKVADNVVHPDLCFSVINRASVNDKQRVAYVKRLMDLHKDMYFIEQQSIDRAMSAVVLTADDVTQTIRDVKDLYANVQDPHTLHMWSNAITAGLSKREVNPVRAHVPVPLKYMVEDNKLVYASETNLTTLVRTSTDINLIGQAVDAITIWRAESETILRGDIEVVEALLKRNLLRPLRAKATKLLEVLLNDKSDRVHIDTSVLAKACIELDLVQQAVEAIPAAMLEAQGWEALGGVDVANVAMRLVEWYEQSQERKTEFTWEEAEAKYKESPLMVALGHRETPFDALLSLPPTMLLGYDHNLTVKTQSYVKNCLGENESAWKLWLLTCNNDSVSTESILTACLFA